MDDLIHSDFVAIDAMLFVDMITDVQSAVTPHLAEKLESNNEGLPS